MNISTIELQQELNHQKTPMNELQRKAIREHPEHSVQILRQLDIKDEIWLKAVLEHHEKLDGSGYPNQLKGDQLSYGTQIISLSDQYCARISPRGHKKPELHKGILRKIFLDEGHEIASDIEKLFIKELGLYPLGTVVKLANSEIAEVVQQGKTLDGPVVCACFHPDLDNYQHPTLRDTQEDKYKIIEVVDCIDNPINFDRRAVWQLQDNLNEPENKTDQQVTPPATESRNEQQQQLNQEIDDLPLLPTAVSQLMTLSTKDENYFKKVHQLAEQDPTFAIRLIRQANSAQSQSISKISTLEHAIARIGAKQIKGLITTFAVAKIFVPTQKSESDLWLHSIHVAVTAQKLATYDTTFNTDPEQAYLCGLLHDIGRFILFKILPDGPLKTDEKEWQNPTQLIFAEQEACGINHAQLGIRASKKWGLAEDISHVISQHHRYKYTANSHAEKKLVQLNKIIQMADSYSMLRMKNQELPELAEQELTALLTNTCIHRNWDQAPIKIESLVSEIHDIDVRTNQIASSLNISI